jgi:hypothetical protein
MLSLSCCAAGVPLRKFLPIPTNSRVFPTLSYINFRVCGVILRSLIHVCLQLMWEVGLPSSPVEFSSLHHSHKLSRSWLLGTRPCSCQSFLGPPGLFIYSSGKDSLPPIFNQCESTSCIAILISTSNNLCSSLLFLIFSLHKIRDKGKIVSAGYWGGCGEREGVEWVVRGGWGQGREIIQVLYAHMNNKTIKIKKNKVNMWQAFCFSYIWSEGFSLRHSKIWYFDTKKYFMWKTIENKHM